MALDLPHLTDSLGATMLVGSEEDFPQLESIYVGSEFADLIETEMFNILLVTNQDSPEVLRACGETDVVAILYTNGQKPNAPELKKAKDMGITILTTAQMLKSVAQALKGSFSDLQIKIAG